MKNQTRLTLQKGINILYLFLIFFFFLITFNTYKDDKVNLGGDNVSYYLLGKSLASGNGYYDAHMIGEKDGELTYGVPHTHFPPGYPAILASFMKVFGDDLQSAKNVNGYFLLFSALLLFFLLQEIGLNQHLAFVSSIFLLHNYHVLYYSMYMYSEVPFLFFFLLFLYSFIKQKEDISFLKDYHFYISAFSLVLLFYIKSFTVGIIAGMIIYLAYSKKWKEIVAYLSILILAIIPWKIRMSGLHSTSYLTYLSYKNPYKKELGFMELSDWFLRFWSNVKRYISVEIPDGLLPMNPIYNYKTPPPFYSWIIGILLISLAIYGLLRLKKHRLLLFLIIGSLLGILMLWPQVWFGKRFILPLIPLLYGLIFYGLQNIILLPVKKYKPKLEPKVTVLSSFALFVLFIPSKNTMKYMSFVAESPIQPKYKNYFTAAEWVKNNSKDSSITACRKPHLFHLYSEKFVVPYARTPDADVIINDFKNKKVDYVIIDPLGFSSTGRYLVPAMKKYQGKFKQVFKTGKPETFVFQFLPNLGYEGEWKGDVKEGKGEFTYFDGTVYNGEWKNNVREGSGTYKWTNGTVYTGLWKNNMREGKGVLSLPNGNIIKTTWHRDTMQGPAEITNPNGEITMGFFNKNIFTKNQ